MKTNSQVQKETSITGTSDGHDAVLAQHAANGKVSQTPDYSKMEQEIDKIKNPVPFDEIKDFFNVD